MSALYFEFCTCCGAKLPPKAAAHICQACFGILGARKDVPPGTNSDSEQLSLALASNCSDDTEPELLELAEPALAEPALAEPALAEPALAEWTREEYVALAKKKKLARAYARKTGETLFYDEISCASCGSGSEKIRAMPDGGGVWRLVCQDCSESVRLSAIERAVTELSEFAEKETQFRAGSGSAEAPMADWAKAILDRALKERAAEALRNDRKMIEVFPEKQLSSVLNGAGIQSGDADEKGRVRLTMRRLMDSSGFRPLAVPGPAWQAQVEELQEHFPNFATAISDVILPSLAIAEAGGRARPAPLLLVGPPGVGKSYFAEALSKMLCVPRAKIDMAAATMGAGIGGLSTHWGNAGPGEVFKILAFGRGGVDAVANPIIFLDEIDKVGSEMRYDPIAPLYSLLELESSRKFEDESLPGLEVDTSHIRWILCANRTESIPGPILSRVHAVHVREPTEFELRHIRARIFSGVVKSLGCDFEDWIPPSVLHGAGNQGPREFKTLCVMAIGKALANGKYRVREKDFESGLPAPVNKMGFM